MIFDIAEVENKIGYVFKDKLLLRKCFTHASFAYENQAENNEILEFFGDAILDFIITEYLYENEKGDEGDLTKKRANLVSRQPLQEAVFRMELDKFLLLGSCQKKNRNLEDKMYSSLYEAIVAGLYIDGGIIPTRKFIISTLIKYKNGKKEIVKQKTVDFKSALQEYVQKRKLGTIKYQDVNKVGPDHAPIFEVALYIDGKKMGTGKGSSKKQAERQIAEKVLLKYKKVKK